MLRKQSAIQNSTLSQQARVDKAEEESHWPQRLLFRWRCSVPAPHWTSAWWPLSSNFPLLGVASGPGPSEALVLSGAFLPSSLLTAQIPASQWNYCGHRINHIYLLPMTQNWLMWELRALALLYHSLKNSFIHSFSSNSKRCSINEFLTKINMSSMTYHH